MGIGKPYFKCQICVWLMLLIGCSQSHTGDLRVIEVGLKKVTDLHLSDVSREINVIALETSEVSYINSIYDLFQYDDRLYIQVSSQKVLIFDLEGNFIQELGNRGEGPGEHQYIKSITVDKKIKEIYLTSTKKVLVFSKTHEFLREKLLKNTWDYLYFSNEKRYTVEQKYGVPNELGYVNYTSLYELNSELSIIDTLSVRAVQLNANSASSYPFNHYLSSVDHDLFYYASVLTNEEFLRDTLYQIKESEAIPYLKLDFGKLILNEKGIKSTWIYNIVHSKSYIICEYSNLGDKMFFLYDKKESKGYNMKEGLLDSEGDPIVLRPYDLSNDMFYYIKKSAYTNLSTEEENPLIGIVYLK